MTYFCYLITNCLSSDSVFKFVIAGVSGLLVPRSLFLLHFFHTGVGSG